MTIKNRIDYVTFSPLLLLLFLPVSGPLVAHLTKTAAHPEISVLKYLFIPLIGFSMGAVLFLGIVRNGWKLPVNSSLYVERHTTRIISFFACMALIYLASIAVLRYTTLHTFVFDMGMYDNKLWRISVIPLSVIPLTVSQGHFQPILILYAMIYKVADSPVIILGLQAATVVSGVIPLYLIAKEHLRKPFFVFLVTVIYLLYPAVEFNAALDFHPDHLYVPLMLWAFYFAERNKYKKAIICACLAAMTKEPFILGTAFFGLYLILEKRKKILGSLTFLVSFSMFLVVVFLIFPYTTGTHSIIHESFPFTEVTSKEGYPRVHLLIDSLLMWKVRKLLFIYLLFTPLLFLPLLEWKRFLPAVPFLVIPLMSTLYLHSSADSQYTAGVIAPAFVALIFSFKRLEERLGLEYAKAFAMLVLVMTLTFNVANSPSLLSINFWKEGPSEIWHKSAFTRGGHENIIEKAIHKVPVDPAVNVCSQGNINLARLAHRYNYWLFPERWQDADYIILDTKRPLMVDDRVDPATHHKVLDRIKNNPGFKLEFKQDGVLLFKKLK